MAVSENLGIEINRIFKGALGKVVLIALLIVPILYGALYLWAFWDPYGSIDKLPVALVNNDRSYTSSDGTSITGGKDLVDKLTGKDQVFKWDVVTSAQADKGLDKGKYYLSMTIPSDFSEKIGTADSDDPVPAMIYAKQDFANNFIATSISSRIFSEIRSETAQSVSETYYKKVFEGFETSRGSLGDAQKGAAKLHTGLKTAKSGATKLATGLGTAARGTATLESGTNSLADGLAKLDSGGKTLAGGTSELAVKSKTLDFGAKKINSGVESIDSGLSSLVGGAGQVDLGVATLQSKMSEAASGAGALSAGAAGNKQYVYAMAGIIDTLLATDGSTLSDAQKAQMAGTASAAKSVAGQVDAGASGLSSALSAASPQVKTLKEGTSSLLSGAKALKSGSEELADGTATLSGGTGALVSGTKTISNGASKISANLSTAAAGADDVATGTNKLAAGSIVLHKGASSLASGLVPAVTGSLDLADGLRDGIKDLPDYSKAQQAANAEMMSNPVRLTTKDIGKTANYGTGFAPYFLPLALWVGSLIGYLFLDPLPKTKRRNKSLRASAARTVVGYTPMALLALVQSFILCFVVERGLGLAPVRTFWFYVTVIIAALVYVAILQWLNASFGPIGKFFAIILLMLQLTSAGGTFPIELQSRFFQVLHPLMPMSYIVGALRNAIAGGPVSNIIHNLIPLVCFGLAAFILTIIAAGTKLSDTAAELGEKVGL